MSERRKDDRDRLKLPNDLIEAIEERAKRRKLSNPAMLRELLARAEREEIAAVEIEAQKSILDVILTASNGYIRDLEAAEVIAGKRHELVLAELRALKSATVEAGATNSARLAKQAAPSPVKRRDFDFTFWHLAISIAFFVVGWFGGLNSR